MWQEPLDTNGWEIGAKMVRNDGDKNSVSHNLDQPHTMCTGSSSTVAWKSRCQIQGLIWGVIKHASKGIHIGFETHNKCHRNSKTGVSVAPQKGPKWGCFCKAWNLFLFLKNNQKVSNAHAYEVTQETNVGKCRQSTVTSGK